MTGEGRFMDEVILRGSLLKNPYLSVDDSLAASS